MSFAFCGAGGFAKTKFASLGMTCLHDLRDGLSVVDAVVEGGERDGLRDCVDVIGVLDLVKRLDEVPRPDAVSDAKPRERVALRERAHDDHVPVARGGRERHAVGAREVGVRLVDQNYSLEPARERGDGRGLAELPRRGVGVGQEEKRQAVVERRPPNVDVRAGGPARRKADPLDVPYRRERLVERVAWIERSDRLVVLDEGACAQREYLVRAVADEHAIRGGSVRLRDRLRERGAVRVWVAAQAVQVERGEDLRALRRRRIRVFVSVELDYPPGPWLFSRDVAFEAADVACYFHLMVWCVLPLWHRRPSAPRCPSP